MACGTHGLFSNVFDCLHQLQLTNPKCPPYSKQARGTTDCISVHHANTLKKAGLGLRENDCVNLDTFAKFNFSSIRSLLCLRQQEIKQNCKRRRYSNQADRSHLLHGNTQRCTCNMESQNKRSSCWEPRCLTQGSCSDMVKLSKEW